MKQVTLSVSALVLGLTLVACGGDKAAEETQAQEAAPAKQVQEAAPAEQVQEAAPAEQAQEAAPAEQAQEVAPAEQAQEAAPAEQAQEVAPAEQAQEAAPAEQAQEAAPVEQAAASSADGEAVYKGLCFSCHDTGVAGSPKIGDAAAWAPRIAAGMETMYETSLNGKGAMPARGGNPTLSDDEIKAAVDYMVSQSQ
jgi:cytochrome c5